MENQKVIPYINISIQKVIESPLFSSITITTAKRIQENMYFTLPEFLKSLSVNDLCCLSLMVELAQTNNNILYELSILSSILATSDGFGISVEDPNFKDLSLDNLNFLCALISCESLSRKGVVTLFYKNISFDPAMSCKDMVELNEAFKGFSI